jgi:hypothetical protein
MILPEEAGERLLFQASAIGQANRTLYTVSTAEIRS